MSNEKMYEDIVLEWRSNANEAVKRKNSRNY